MNTTEELKTLKIREINPETVCLLSTVTLKESVCNCCLYYTDDDGCEVLVEPDMTGWQDGRKEVRIHKNGESCTLYFDVSGGYAEPHKYTLNDSRAMDVLWRVPNCILHWAIKKAH